jgi:hypothetical protein
MTGSKITRALALCLAGLAAAGATQASVITMQTRYSTDGAASFGTAAANGAYYRSTVQGLDAGAPTAGYCDATVASYTGLSNQSVCGGSNVNLAFHFGVDFNLSGAQAGDFSLRVGPDFGLGGAVFLDGQLLGVRTTDMWWSGSYGSASQIFEFDNLALLSGLHHLDIVGLEACCDGAQEAQFRLASGRAWTTFSVLDGLKAVPEPGSVPLVLAGLGGLALLQRRRARMPGMNQICTRVPNSTTALSGSPKYSTTLLAFLLMVANSFSRHCAMPLPGEGTTVSRLRK